LQGTKHHDETLAKEKACCPVKESLVPQIAAQQNLDLHGDYSSVSIHSVTLT
jgi:hypothetical protein